MKLLFVGLFRRYVARMPPGSTGWFAALNHPVVARALRLIHAQPARAWTVDEIAQWIGSSRSVLAGRFKALIGRPPIDCLLAWRIQIAAERLRAAADSLPRAWRRASATSPKPPSVAPSSA